MARYELRLKFPSDALVVGCEVVPEVGLFSMDGSQTPDHRFEFNWYRLDSLLEGPTCSIHSSESATLQCLLCMRTDLLAPESYHCSSECFRDSWHHHQNHHALCNIEKPALEESFPRDSLIDEFPTMTGACYKTWVKLCSSKTYTPVKEDVGCWLRLDCSVLDCGMGEQLAPLKAIKSRNIIVAPERCHRNMIQGIQKKVNRFGVFTVLSYNILADMYAILRYNYCPTWARTWQYRRQLLVDEIVGYQADIICLQEVQDDHFAEFFEPELRKVGYTAVYKGKTLTHHFKGKKVHEGCATFYRHDRFQKIEEYQLEFNENAWEMVEKLEESLKSKAACRLMKNNVALMVVLKFKEGTFVSDVVPPSYRKSICVVNVHIHANQSETDTKIFQVKVLLETLEMKCAANVPILICADLNSLPGSAPYDLVVLGNVGRYHPDLNVDPACVISNLRLSHCLPKLASAYPSFLENTDVEDGEYQLLCPPFNEPCFTFFGKKFSGPIDYIFYTADALTCDAILELLDEETARKHTALPSPLWPSDHIAIMAAFRWKSEPME